MSGDISPTAFVAGYGCKMFVKGAIIDTILDQTNALDNGKVKYHWETEELTSPEWTQIRDWHLEARVFAIKQESPRYLGKVQRLKALIRLIGLDAFRHSAKDPDHIGDGVQIYIDALNYVSSRTRQTQWILTGMAEDNRVPAMIKSLGMIPQGYRLCMTYKGYFGLVPMKASKEDKVCIIPGIFYPVILRPDSNHCYNFIGGAFIIEITDGEALDFADFELRGLLLS